jgi:hypothetical protein
MSDGHDKERKMSEQPSPFPEDTDVPDREPVAAASEHRSAGTPHGRRTGPLWGGLILVVVGLVLLLQNAGYDVPILRNWWALFILFPVVNGVRRAQWALQRNGNRVTGAVAGPLVSAAALTLVMMALLLGLNWSVVLPIALILIGLGALISALPASHR